jgi:hypothetical protein
MKIDCGFWDKRGFYQEDIQEIKGIELKEIYKTLFCSTEAKKKGDSPVTSNPQIPADASLLGREFQEE